MILDSVCKIYGDLDLVYGFRIGVTRSPELQEAMCNLQQSRYIEALNSVQKYRSSLSKRDRKTYSLDEAFY